MKNNSSKMKLEPCFTTFLIIGLGYFFVNIVQLKNFHKKAFSIPTYSNGSFQSSQYPYNLFPQKDITVIQNPVIMVMAK